MAKDSPNLFVGSYRNDVYWVPKEFFNCMNDSKFMDMLENLLDGVIYGHETGLCEFPDPEEADGDFLGVRFTAWDGEVAIVSNDVTNALLLEASQRYVQINPEKRVVVENVFRKRGKNLYPKKQLK